MVEEIKSTVQKFTKMVWENEDKKKNLDFDQKKENKLQWSIGRVNKQKPVDRVILSDQASRETGLVLYQEENFGVQQSLKASCLMGMVIDNRMFQLLKDAVIDLSGTMALPLIVQSVHPNKQIVNQDNKIVSPMYPVAERTMASKDFSKTGKQTTHLKLILKKNIDIKLGGENGFEIDGSGDAVFELNNSKYPEIPPEVEVTVGYKKDLEAWYIRNEKSKLKTLMLLKNQNTLYQGNQNNDVFRCIPDSQFQIADLLFTVKLSNE